MAYTSIRGRKPVERASKISHRSIIANPAVEQLLSECAIPRPADPATVEALLRSVPEPAEQLIRAVVAVDGAMREVSVRDDFPSASVTFFTFGPLLFELDALRALDREPFIAPEDLARLKNIQRYELALPTRNISRNGTTLRDSVRRSLHEFFARPNTGDEPLYKTLRWILFRGWTSMEDHFWDTACPNDGCERTTVRLLPSSPDEQPCTACGKPIYLIDAARLHERIDEDQGAGGISAYVLALCEQVAMIHVIRAAWQMKRSLLREMLFIKDGPLACFGLIAPLSRPLRELAIFLGNQPDPTRGQVSLLNVAGLEKSGPFVEHAAHIEESLRPGSVLPLSNDYIYRHVVPGDPDSGDPYGVNTYWGGKLIFRATDGNTYVATVPTAKGFTVSPQYEDFPNLTQVLAAIAELRCSMYDNALVPVALANRLISLSEVPSTRILETFAREQIGLQ